jgi:release factor glutamine methyltransferase
MFLRDILQNIRKELRTLYPQREIESFIFLIFEHILNFSKIDIHTKADTKLSFSQINQINEIIVQLKNHRPIQYILGKTEFFGLNFIVSDEVLIPRPETEELVKWIVDEYKNKKLNILDIGTGSGCIAVSLAKNIPDSCVDATDISEQSLQIAKLNAEKNQVNINFYLHNILNQKSEIRNQKYDIVVSNPPYIRESEKKQMQQNVLDYEPHRALFVPDENPLIFYEAVLKFAEKNLKKNGSIYCEINEALHKENRELFLKYNYSEIQVVKDLNDKYRMICGKKC